MIPILALVGRPNVGKSTLFNRLTRSRKALVADIPGLTRDRIYGKCVFEDQPFILIDTGGIGEEQADLDFKVNEQAMLAIAEADAILFLVDGSAGLSAGDQNLANQLRAMAKPLFLVVNKCDDFNTDHGNEFYELALGPPICISATHNLGVQSLLDNVCKNLQLDDEASQADDLDEHCTRIAIIGKPNVGKSTLVNCLFGENRVLVFDLPGTTRDSTDLPFEKNGKSYMLIDTAGVRRRAKITDKIEKFSVVKSLQSIENANVVIFLIDGKEGITEQDATLLGFIVEAGRALVLAVNKTEAFTRIQKEQLLDTVNSDFSFVSFAKLRFISALHAQGMESLWCEVEKAYKNATRKISTPVLTKILEQAVQSHPPHLVHGRRIKLRYAHQGGQNPPVIVIHGNQAKTANSNYQKYLTNYFQKALKLQGTPLRLIFKTGKNPFSGNKNPLTSRQLRKRKRLLKHVKKK